VDSLTGFDENGRMWSTNTFLIHPSEDKELIQLQYGCSQKMSRRGVVVEHAAFVDNCIDRDVFVHRLKARKGMPGRPPGHRMRWVHLSLTAGMQSFE
jgi:hypothetical protein